MAAIETAGGQSVDLGGSMRERSFVLLRLVVAVVVVFAIAPSVVAASSSSSGGWLGQGPDPAALQAEVARHANKLPGEFHERLRYVLPDGTLQVMVSLTHRDTAIEEFVQRTATWLTWYGDDPRFLARVTQDGLAALLRSPAVLFVEPDYPLAYFMSASTVDVNARSLDNSGTGLWAFDSAAQPYGALRSDVPGVDVSRLTGRGVTVAVTDSGIDRTHRDFGGFSCEPGPYQPCESRIKHAVTVEQLVDAGISPPPLLPTTEAASGHGTHVAGTIAGNGFYTRDGDNDPARYGGDGRVIGMAPEASLVSVKNGDSQWAGLATLGLQWTLDNAEEYGIRVSSNSWGCLGGCSFNANSATARVLRDLYHADVVVTFAVGNDAGGPDGKRFSGDAQSPYVLGVAAYDDANDQLASFSSRGDGTTKLVDAATWTPESEGPAGVRRPDIAAPGVNIWSARTLTGGTSSMIPRLNLNDTLGGKSSGFVPYATMSGTSMATPHVAGAAALLIGACPEATALDVMRAVMTGGNRSKIQTTGGSRVAEPYEVGYGGLDVRASLNWLLAQPTCGGEATPTNTAPTG